MDLTEFGLDKIEAGESSGGGDRVKPGRYNFEYAGSEMIEGIQSYIVLAFPFQHHAQTNKQKMFMLNSCLQVS